MLKGEGFWNKSFLRERDFTAVVTQFLQATGGGSTNEEIVARVTNLRALMQQLVASNTTGDDLYMSLSFQPSDVSNAMKGVTPEVRVKVCKAIVQKLGLQRGFALLGRLPVEEESKLPCIGSFLPDAHSDEDAATLQTEVYHQWLDDLPTAKDIATLEEIITHLPQALDVPKVLWDQC